MMGKKLIVTHKNPKLSRDARVLADKNSKKKWKTISSNNIEKASRYWTLIKDFPLTAYYTDKSKV